MYNEYDINPKKTNILFEKIFNKKGLFFINKINKDVPITIGNVLKVGWNFSFEKKIKEKIISDKLIKVSCIEEGILEKANKTL